MRNPKAFAALRWLFAAQTKAATRPERYKNPTFVSHSVHLGEGVALLVKASTMDGASPIYTITVKTSDEKFKVKIFFDDRDQYVKLRDGMRLVEKSYNSFHQPVTMTWKQRKDAATSAMFEAYKEFDETVDDEA